MAGFTGYFTFFLIEKFDLSVTSSQLYLFFFLGSVAAGTFFGGPIGDKTGRKKVIWFSILGARHLPWQSLSGSVLDRRTERHYRLCAGVCVFRHCRVRSRTGAWQRRMIAGVFFGLMFGFGGMGAALLGQLADVHGIEYVFKLCSYLPLLGILTILLSSTKGV